MHIQMTVRLYKNRGQSQTETAVCQSSRLSCSSQVPQRTKAEICEPMTAVKVSLGRMKDRNIYGQLLAVENDIVLRIAFCSVSERHGKGEIRLLTYL